MSNYLIQKQPSEVLCKNFSWKFRNIHRTAVLEFFFIKVARLQACGNTSVFLGILLTFEEQHFYRTPLTATSVYPLRSPENQRFFDDFKKYSMASLVTNGLKNLFCKTRSGKWRHYKNYVNKIKKKSVLFLWHVYFICTTVEKRLHKIHETK